MTKHARGPEVGTTLPSRLNAALRGALQDSSMLLSGASSIAGTPHTLLRATGAGRFGYGGMLSSYMSDISVHE